MDAINLQSILDSRDESVFDVRSHAPGARGKLPFTAKLLREWSSGALLGWEPDKMGGIRAPDGTPIALGYHIGHWEVGLLMQAGA
jgi:hypothetical protein